MGQGGGGRWREDPSRHCLDWTSRLDTRYIEGMWNGILDQTEARMRRDDLEQDPGCSIARNSEIQGAAL